MINCNGILKIGKLDVENKILSGSGLIEGKEYEFYLDGSDDSSDLCLDIHKAWIKNNSEAWDAEKSLIGCTMYQAIKHGEYLISATLISNRIIKGDL